MNNLHSHKNGLGNRMNKAIYLKTNSCEKWAINNLHIWMKVGVTLGYPIYIVCDKDTLIEEIKKLEFYESVSIIPSVRTGEIKKVTDAIATEGWKKAAHAHLTTFYDAYERGYSDFWNIDADDIFLCLPIDRIVELLIKVEDKAESSNDVCTSLDMWYSRSEGTYWSFGITFVRRVGLWKNWISGYCDFNNWNAEFGNVDNYFGFLAREKCKGINLWYCDNLIFFHQDNDLGRRLIRSGIYHFHDGKVEFPVTKAFGAFSEIASYPILDEVCKIPMLITDEEAKDVMVYNTEDEHIIFGFGRYEWYDVEGKAVSRIRLNRYMDSLQDGFKLIVFGTGHMFSQKRELIESIYDIHCVADNNSQLWGQKIGEKYNCISPQQITEMDNILVLILVEREDFISEIAKQLRELGLKFLTYSDWCKICFCDYGGYDEALQF